MFVYAALLALKNSNKSIGEGLPDHKEILESVEKAHNKTMGLFIWFIIIATVMFNLYIWLT
ncbi:hypothetical protein [Cognatishimia sp.]|uniref:hypothetical protein n=1 Tax=Cognatishimia sp. TaxID=2211648 RepID=UPI003513F1A3|nr:hypothetical protein [Cognatishimia sp.]